MPADFWAGWVLTLTVLSVAGFAWFVFSLYFGGDGNRGDAEDESPRWDGNLREGFHPAPMWWFWLTLASLVFSVVYLMLYPGLGSYAGALRWSEGGSWRKARPLGKRGSAPSGPRSRRRRWRNSAPTRH